MTSLREVLVIMARYPEEGMVKTRLARDLGASLAHRLYRAFLVDLAEKFGSLRRPLIWYYVPESSPFPQLFSDRFSCRPQSGSSLQERMRRNGTERRFAKGGYYWVYKPDLRAGEVVTL